MAAVEELARHLRSSAHLARWTEGDVEERMEEVLAFFGARGRRFTWWIGPSSAPASLGRRLRARGFALQGDFTAMTAELPLPPSEPPPGLEVREVSDERTALDSVRVGFWRASARDADWLARERAAYVRCAAGGAAVTSSRIWTARRSRPACGATPPTGGP